MASTAGGANVDSTVSGRCTTCVCSKTSNAYYDYSPLRSSRRTLSSSHRPTGLIASTTA